MVQLLAVLRGYMHCVPETFMEARFDVSRLLQQARTSACAEAILRAYFADVPF
jgi:hypothetical protein